MSEKEFTCFNGLNGMIEDETYIDSAGNTITCKNGMLFFTPPLSEYTPTVIGGEPQYWFTDLKTPALDYSNPVTEPDVTSIAPETPDNKLLLIGGGIVLLGIIGVTVYILKNKTDSPITVPNLPIG